MLKTAVLSAILSLLVLALFAEESAAQTQYEPPIQTYPTQNTAPTPDRYPYCQQQAQRMSGYFGATPNRYKPNNGLQRAAKQAQAVDAIAWIAGADKKKRKKLRQKAALDGFLKGAIQRGIAKDRERKARERYQFELRTCMGAG